jgi:universal stress protein A
MGKTFTKILVPVDFSVHSSEATLYAASIAERFFASMVMLHIISKEIELHTVHRHAGHRGSPLLGPLSTPLDISGEVIETVGIDLRERALTALHEFLPPESRRQPHEVVVRVGRPFEEILHVVADMHIDLIVMGTHGRSGLTHAMLGSVAERVVRLAPCPVLTVKAPVQSAS